MRKPLEQLIQELDISKTVKIAWLEMPAGKLLKYLTMPHIMIAPSITSPQERRSGGHSYCTNGSNGYGFCPLSALNIAVFLNWCKIMFRVFLVPEQDIEGLAEKLNYLLEHPEIWPIMGKAGHLYVKEHHDIEKTKYSTGRNIS